MTGCCFHVASRLFRVVEKRVSGLCFDHHTFRPVPKTITSYSSSILIEYYSSSTHKKVFCHDDYTDPNASDKMATRNRSTPLFT